MRWTHYYRVNKYVLKRPKQYDLIVEYNPKEISRTKEL